MGKVMSNKIAHHQSVTNFAEAKALRFAYIIDKTTVCNWAT